VDFSTARVGAGTVFDERRPAVGTRTRFAGTVIASEARQSRWGKGGYYGSEIAASLCSSRWQDGHAWTGARLDPFTPRC